MSALVSVVIPTYNRRTQVVEAIQSVLDQSYRPIELVVVDDGSTDGTEEALRPFADQIAGGELVRCPPAIRFRYVRQENRGPSAARNHGIRISTGEMVAWLDSDDLWDPTKLEKQVRLLERSPRVGLVFCELWRFHPDTGERITSHCRIETPGDFRRALLCRNRFSTPTVLVRRECLDRVGLFDETLRWAEDWDLWIRISRHYHFDCVREPLVNVRRLDQGLETNVGGMHESQMKVVRRAFEQDPIDRRNWLLLRQVLAYVHEDAGGGYLKIGQHRRALSHLVRSVFLCPFDSYYHRSLIRALLLGCRGSGVGGRVGKGSVPDTRPPTPDTLSQ